MTEIEGYISAGAEWVIANPLPFVLGVLLACVVLVLIGAALLRGLVKRARRANAAETKTVQAYREAVGRLMYQKPFSDDEAALKAIDQVRDFDIQTLKLFEESTPVIAENNRALQALGTPATGFRDRRDGIFKLYLSFKDRHDLERLRAQGYHTNARYNGLRATSLSAQIARHTVCEAHILNALSSYIDAGQIITEAAKGSRPPREA